MVLSAKLASDSAKSLGMIHISLSFITIFKNIKNPLALNYGGIFSQWVLNFYIDQGLH
jgi:hypothetical protein